MPKKGILFELISEYRTLYVAIFITSVASAAIETLTVAAMLPLFNLLLSPGSQISVPGMSGFSDLLSKLPPAGDPIVALSIFLLVLIILRGVAGMLNEFLMGYAGGR